ncbi:MAG: DUF1653 domain-containing protein [Tatlockia sp.]|nr:DUF1653 domain-containing protein [Tatlockia sp.]
MLQETLLHGKYRHYKNAQFYEVIAQARHSETQEEMVVYKALYHCDKFGDNQIWVRPVQMFFEKVIHNGQMMPRFQRIEQK